MFENKAMEVAEMLNSKNVEYGSAYEKMAEILTLLYPDGIKPEKYDEVILTVRIIDTLMRIAHSDYPKGYKHIAGFGILGMCKHDKQNN